MERSSKLVDLTLVSKYYPVANYSYPRNEGIMHRSAHSTATTSSNVTHIAMMGPMVATHDRSSMGSDASAPGLIDDRTDSEHSGDEDYQYHAHTTELWDSFWRAGSEERKRLEQQKLYKNELEQSTKADIDVNPRKQYPALIPSPQQRRSNQYRQQEDTTKQAPPAWPLPDSSTQGPRRRQPAATYSPFPRPIALPQPGKPRSPSWECSRQRDQPRRPPRPDERLLTPCLNQQTSPVAAVFPPLQAPEHIRPRTSQEHHRMVQTEAAPPVVSQPCEASHHPKTSASSIVRPPTPGDALVLRPRTSSRVHRPPPISIEPRRPKSSRCLRPTSPIDVPEHRPKTSLSNRPPTPGVPRDHNPSLLSPTLYFPVPPDPHRGQISPEPSPQSFFEEDSDSEETSRSFFRFHKRAGSDLPRQARQPEVDPPRRRRGLTTPSPTRPSHTQTTEKKRPGADVFGRMLGRRSR